MGKSSCLPLFQSLPDPLCCGLTTVYQTRKHSFRHRHEPDRRTQQSVQPCPCIETDPKRIPIRRYAPSASVPAACKTPSRVIHRYVTLSSTTYYPLLPQSMQTYARSRPIVRIWNCFIFGLFRYRMKSALVSKTYSFYTRSKHRRKAGLLQNLPPWRTGTTHPYKKNAIALKFSVRLPIA